MYHFVIPSFNSMPFLEKTLQSIEVQKGPAFRVVVIDDASTFHSHRQCVQSYCKKNRWQALFHEENMGALKSIVDGIKLLSPDDDDVIVLVDGDDWLAHDGVLKKLEIVYGQEKSVWITWGQYQVSPKAWLPTRPASPVPEDVLKSGDFRAIPWIFWPLRTFKAFLWREILDGDLRDSQGEYYRLSWDQALMFPMLEMARERSFFVDEVLYIYNLENPLSDFKISRDEQELATEEIRRKKPYKRLNRCG